MGIFDKIAEKFSGSPQDIKKPLENTSDQSSDEQRLASYVKSKVEEVRGQANRAALEALWMRNTAAVMGFTGVYWDSSARNFKPINNVAGGLKKNRLHSNLILPACQNRLARLCKSPPKYEVLPNSMEEEDKDAAELALDCINNTWDEQKIDLKRLNAYMYMQQCGHVWKAVSFDPELGEDMQDPLSGELIGKAGAVRVDIVSPFEVFVDPLAKSMDDVTWLARCKVRKLDYFKKRWPEKGGAVKEEGAWLLSAQYDMRINTLNSSAQGPGGGQIQDQMKNAAIEISYYEGPSTEHPKGRLVIIANGVMLEDKELPVGEIPFVKYDDIIVGGKFYPEASVTHAVPLQEQYNRNLQRYSDWTNKLLAGKYIAARGHGLQAESLNDQNGEVVEYDPVPNAQEPHAMQIPVMPQYVFAQQESLTADLNQQFGLSEVSRGIMPSAGIPAIGMQLLVQQDETRIGIEVEQHEWSDAKLGQLILKYIGNFYKTERKLKMKKGGKYSIKTFTGEDLKENYDVKVVKGSTIPNNLFLKRQEIMNAYQQGLLGDPMDPMVKDRVLNDMQFGDTQEIWKDIRLDRSQIKRQIDGILLRSEMPVIDEMDNHDLFIKEINDFRKSEEFDELVPLKKNMLLMLREGHIQMKSQMMAPNLPVDDADLDVHDEIDSNHTETTNTLNETETSAPAEELPVA